MLCLLFFPLPSGKQIKDAKKKQKKTSMKVEIWRAINIEKGYKFGTTDPII